MKRFDHLQVSRVRSCCFLFCSVGWRRKHPSCCKVIGCGLPVSYGPSSVLIWYRLSRKLWDPGTFPCKGLSHWRKNMLTDLLDASEFALDLDLKWARLPVDPQAKELGRLTSQNCVCALRTFDEKVGMLPMRRWSGRLRRQDDKMQWRKQSPFQRWHKWIEWTIPSHVGKGNCFGTSCSQVSPHNRVIFGRPADVTVSPQQVGAFGGNQWWVDPPLILKLFCWRESQTAFFVIFISL